ncbi:O-antigen ligase family protein, partial [Candidatus Sumerlaeota bacterium]|nr:O-antigen ligase family protein [Candidatus Sumerlaeota bacterium]
MNPATGAITSPAHGERALWVLGGAAALLLAAFFVYPSRPYPIQSLIFTALLYFVALVVCVQALRFRRGEFLAQLGRLGPLALGAFAIWTFLRWQTAHVTPLVGPPETVRVSSAGRAGVVATQLMLAGFALGLGLASLGPKSGVRVWTVLRTALIAAALWFSGVAFYQFFIGYDKSLDLLLEGSGLRATLERQSLEFALRQRRVGGALGNGNVFAAWLAILAGFCLSAWTRPSSRRLKALSGLAYAMAASAILLTGSRGGLLTLLLATLWALAILWRSSGARLRPGRLHRAGAALLFLAMAEVASAAAIWSRLSDVATIRERLFYWGIALKVWGMNWIAGAGPGAFPLYYARFKPPAAHESRYAHSWIFQLGAETGFVGLGLFLLFVLALAIVARRAWIGSRGAMQGSGDAAGDATGDAAVEANWLAMGCGLLLFNGLFEYS